MSGKAKTAVSVLKISSNELARLRDKYETFDESLMEYEDFIEDDQVRGELRL